MTKEDKQIIDRAVKEEWRIGDRTRLRRLLEKNLKQYRDIVELERKLEQAEKRIEELELELTVEKDLHQEETNLHLHAENYIKSLEQQIVKMKRHCNCKHRDGEGYCEVKRTYLMDLTYDGCDKWELED